MNLNKINNFVAEHPEDGSIKDITLCNNVTNKEFHLQPAECQPIVDNMAEAVKCVTVGNGTTTVTPDPGYNSMRSVVVCAKVPVENKSILLSNNNSNTCIKPSPGYTGLSGVNVCVAIPTSCPTCCYTKNGNYVISKGLIPLACANVCVDVPIQDPVAVCITKSGTCTIKPTTGNVGLSEVDITTDFNTIDEVNCNITSNGDYTIHTPAGYSAMGTANINVNVPAPTIHAQTCHVTLTQNDRYVEYTPEFGQDYFDKFIVCTNIPTCGVNCTITSNGKYAINSALLGGLINSVSLNVNVVDGGGSIVPVAPITKYHIHCSSYYDNTEDNSGKCGLIFTPWSLDGVSGMTPEERNDYMKGKEITAILYNYGGYACDIPVNKAAGCWDSNEGHALNCGCLFAYADYLCYEIGQCGPVFVFETRCTRDSVAPYTWSKFGGAGSGCIYKLSVYGCAGEWEQHDGGFNAPVDITCCITENGHYILHCDGDYINCATVIVDTPVQKTEESFICNISENGEYCFEPSNPDNVFANGRVCVTARRCEETANKCYTANGEYSITPVTTGNVLTEATVCVDIPHNSKSCNITTINNCSVEITPDAGAYLDGACFSVTIPKECGVGNYTANGTYKITPANGKLLECADITVAVPNEAVTCCYYCDGTYVIEPSEGSYLNKATVIIDTPDKKNEEAKSCCYTANGTYSITPTSNTTTLCKVDVTVAIPTEQATKTYTSNGNYTITPSTGNYLDSVTVCVNTPVRKAEETKSCTYTANGNYTITPTSGKVLSSATVCVNIPTETKSCSWNVPGSWTITPSTGKYLSAVDVAFTVPTETKTCCFTQNGNYTIPASTGKYMTSNTVCVAIPTETKTCNISENGCYVINPSSGKYLSKVTICNTARKTEETKTCCYTANGNYTISPTTGNVLSSVGVCVAIPTETKTCCYTANGNYTITPSTGKYISGATVCVNIPTETKYCELSENGCIEITPSTGKYLSKVTICNTAQKTEETKTCTYVANGEYTITPTTGNVLSSATVCVDIPLETKTCCYTANGEYTISRSSGKYMTSNTVTVDVPITIAGNVCASCSYNEVGLTYAPAINTSGDCFGKMCGAYGTVFGKNCYQFYTPGDIANKNGRYKGTFICNGNCIAGPDTAWICLVCSNVCVFVEGCQTQWSWIRCAGYEFSLTF